nr:hypothetical protein [Sphingomonas sp. MM-1]
MRTDLDHRPAAKQRELERAIAILFEGGQRCRHAGERKLARVPKIILYGSHAGAGSMNRILRRAIDRISTY